MIGCPGLPSSVVARQTNVSLLRSTEAARQARSLGSRSGMSANITMAAAMPGGRAAKARRRLAPMPSAASGMGSGVISSPVTAE